MQKKDKPCPFIVRRGWCIKGQECDFSHANLVNNLDLRKPIKTRKVRGPKPSSFLGNRQRNNIISLMNQLETSLQEIESTQTLHEPYPPPSTTATSLSPISSSIPKPLDGDSSVPSFLSPPLRNHISNKSSEPVNTGRADTRVYHQRNNIFQSIPKPHFLPSSTNPISCDDKPQSRIPSASRSRQNVSRLPTFFLSNVRSLNAKIDEFQVVAQQNHVDVTSVSEVINKNEMGKMQCHVNDINTWCMRNDMKLNQTKCKDMIISFALERPKLDPIFIEEHELVPVSSAKILGMYISVDLKWNTHITHIVSKASKHLYFLRLLKRSGVDRYSLLTVFTTCIRPVLEYGCQAWSYGITQYLSDEIERIQKRA